MTRPDNPPEWNDLTPREIGALTEGCGVPDFDPPDLWFHDECRRHDFLYWRGGTREDRREADRIFYNDMRFKAQQASTSLGRWWRGIWAWIYFKAVDWFGGFNSDFNGTMKTWEDVYKEVEAYYEARPHLDPLRPVDGEYDPHAETTTSRPAVRLTPDGGEVGEPPSRVIYRPKQKPPQ